MNVAMRFGVMQGRLSPRPADRLQAFPHASWREELPLAARLGFDTLEWIFEAPRAWENPLATVEGRRQIRRASRDSGVAVASVCGDYFMKHQLSGGDEASRSAAACVLMRTIRWAAEIGATRILLPLLEEAALDTEEKREQILHTIGSCLPAAERFGIVLGLEMEVPAPTYGRIVSTFGHALVRVYYDTGNSTAQGIDIGHDIRPLLPRLEAVHIKDRLIGGQSQPLGCGAANFRGFFNALVQAGFSGDLVLQHWFTEPERDALRALNFVRLGLGRAMREAA
jgi:hexulose-6-phosphate isomerase